MSRGMGGKSSGGRRMAFCGNVVLQKEEGKID
jgi:hypothetical protein